MGIVYRAEAPDGQLVALKTVRVASKSQLSSLRREIHSLARLQHPGIVRILESGVAEGVPWYAMELLEGTNLREFLAFLRQPAIAETSEATSATRVSGPNRAFEVPGSTSHERTIAQTEAGQTTDPELTAPPLRTGTMDLTEPGQETPETEWPSTPAPDWQEGASFGPDIEISQQSELYALLRLIHGLCTPLAFLHGEGLVHRDLKLDNILVRPRGRPVIVDFGLAMQFGGEISRDALGTEGFTAGTVSTMAPEQIRGELVDARADLYALGCILYELVCGRPPFQARMPNQVLWQHLHAQPEAPSRRVQGVPKDLDALILGLLTKNPRQRWGYAEDVAIALEKLGVQPLPRQGNLPPARPYLYRSRFSGRQSVLNRLDETLDRLEQGRGGLLLVGGPSGIGKTRLLLELARRVASREIALSGGDVLPPAASPLKTEPLAPLRKVLQGIADRCREKGLESTQRVLGPRGKNLARYEPALRELPGQAEFPEPAELPADADRLRLYSDLATTLLVLAEEQPLLILLDDLQWADQLTLGFLEFLARILAAREQTSRLLVIGTFRSEETTEALDQLQQRAEIQPIRLGRLDAAEVGRMVGDMLALPRSPTAFVRYLSHQSEGNPFFVAEYLRTAVREGLLWRDPAGHWQIDTTSRTGAEAESGYLPLPQSIRALVARHLDRLSAPAALLAEAASVLGRETEAHVLAQLSELSPGDLMEGIQELLHQQILEETPQSALRFTHDKIREVAHDRIEALRRASLHLRAAETLEALPEEARSLHGSDLAYHWQQAGVPTKAREYFLAAARRNVSLSALEEAERCYKAYLALVAEPGVESIAVRQELAMGPLEFLGRRTEVNQQLETALADSREIGYRPGEAESLLRLARAYWQVQQFDEAFRCADQALEVFDRLQDRHGVARTLEQQAVLHHQQRQMDQALRCNQAALELFQRLGATREQGPVLFNLASLQAEQGHTEEALGLFDEALQRAREAQDRTLEGRVLANQGRLHRNQGRLPEAQHLTEQAYELARQLRNRPLEARFLGLLAILSHAQNHASRARDFHERALQLNRETGDRLGEAYELANLATWMHNFGEIEDLSSLYDQPLAIFRQLGDRAAEGCLLPQLSGWIRQSTGNLEEAIRIAQRAEDLLTQADYKPYLIVALSQRCYAELARNQLRPDLLERAETLCKELGLDTGSMGDGLRLLRRTGEVLAAGRHDLLFRGELVEKLPPGLRRWLVRTGQLEAARAQL